MDGWRFILDVMTLKISALRIRLNVLPKEKGTFDDKRRVVDLMLTTIAATSDILNITWKF